MPFDIMQAEQINFLEIPEQRAFLAPLPHPLKLKHRKPIARGGHRLVYAHPMVDWLVLKVPRPDVRDGSRKDLPFWRKHFRRFKHYNDFAREAAEHVAVYAANERLLPFMQRFYGFVETDMGLASVSRAERDREGNYAPNLAQLLARGKFDKAARAAFEVFADMFVRSDAVVGDLRMENMVYSHDAATDSMRFVIIDGIGDKNAIKMCSLSRYYNRFSKQKRIHRLREKIAAMLAANAKRRAGIL